MTSREPAGGVSGQPERVRRVLTARFLSESVVAEITHLLLPLVALGVLWRAASHGFVIAWAGTIIGVTSARMLSRIGLSRRAGPVDRIPASLRITVVAVGLCWGAGVTVVARDIPLAELALLMVLLCGLAAGATSTLVSDAAVFYGFLIALLAPLTVAVLLNGHDHLHVMASLLIVTFAGTMATLFRRNRSTLLNYLTTADTLEQKHVAEQGERLRAERRFAVRNAVAQVLAEATLDHPVLPTILQTLCEHLGWEAGAAWQLTPGATALHCHDVWSGGGFEATTFLDATRATALSLDSSWLGRACAGAHGVWIATMATAVDEARAAAAARAGIHTVVAVPLKDGASLLGALELFRMGPHDPDPETMAVFGTLGSQIGNAIGRRRADAALRVAESENQALIEGSSDLVWRVDPTGRWTFVNPAAQRIYKMAPESLLGHYMIERCDPGSRDADRAAFARVLAGEELRDYESVHRDSEGMAHAISTSVRPILDAAGQLVAIEGIARDVTERAAAREALREARDAAERATATKSAFLANMSHEIRTPMNGILGMTELLLDTHLTAEQQRCAAVISGSGKNLLAIINDILDLSKIEAQQLELEATEFDLQELVEGVAKLFVQAAAERGIELIIDLPDAVARRVVGDPTRLRQVLTNLVGNAVKFTHDGEVAIVLRAADAAGVSRIRFSVRDSGIGIAPGAVLAIFEPFRQADATTTRKYGGTGLGLSISRHLVDLMGGRLEVESTIGSGSEFHFTVALPDAMLPAAALPAADLGGVRMLLVDDNSTNRRILRGMLARAGCLVDEAIGGEQALAALRRSTAQGVPYRVLISDAGMPGMDGFTLAAAVRADPSLQETRIMILTSADGRGDGKRCIELGVAAYLLKPIARDELLRAVATTLGAEVSPPVTRTSIGEATRSLHVLLAEDNVVNQEVASMMLRRRGHVVDIVNNGREAVEAVERTRYDVALMDMQMPELDGLHATREIRALATGGALRIVALTAGAVAGERDQCLAAGMDDYLSKPFTPIELFAVVENGAPDAERRNWLSPSEMAEGERGAHSRPIQFRSVNDDTSPADGRAPLDLAGFSANLRAAGAEDAAGDLLTLFAEDAPIRLAALEAAVLAGSVGEIASTAHAFKSAAAAIGAAPLSELLDQMEVAGRRSDAGEARAQLDAVRDQLERALRYLADAPREGSRLLG